MSLLRRRGLFGVAYDNEPSGLFMDKAFQQAASVPIAKQNNFNFGLNSFSWSFRVRNLDNASGNMNLIVKRTGSGNGYIIGINKLYPYIRMRSGGVESVAGYLYTIQTGDIANIVFSVSRGVSGWDTTFYVNGVSAGVISNNYNSLDNPAQLFIGDVFFGGDSFDGEFHDCKCFTKALTQTEVAELHNSNGDIVPSTAQSSLVADWRFDDAEGFVATDETGNNDADLKTSQNNYVLADVTKGENNHWVNKEGLPILE